MELSDAVRVWSRALAKAQQCQRTKDMVYFLRGTLPCYIIMDNDLKARIEETNIVIKRLDKRNSSRLLITKQSPSKKKKKKLHKIKMAILIPAYSYRHMTCTLNTMSVT